MKSISISDLPQLTTEQMIEVDRLMMEEWHISIIQMMENAGRNTAMLAKHLLGDAIVGKRIFVLSGKGNNGGGGMVAARHLHNWGADVQVILMGSPEDLKEIPLKQWQILQKMGLIREDVQIEKGNLIIDAMIGYGLVGNPRPPISNWIKKANGSKVPILALDAPTGLNTTTGVQSDLCIQAKATLTLALPKTGLILPEARACVGELYLADISVPPELYAAPSLKMQFTSPFDGEAIVRILN